MKRQGYISWDEYFMGIAMLSAMRSKDPNTQVGACIVNDKHRILSIGYNGAPKGLDDDIMPWDREGEFLKTKYGIESKNNSPSLGYAQIIIGEK